MVYSSSNMLTTHSFILPSRRPIHLRTCCSSILFDLTTSLVLHQRRGSWAQLRERRPLAAYSPLTSLVQPLHWLDISNYSAWRLTLIWPCLSTLNSCNSQAFAIFVLYVRCVLDQSTAAAIASALISSRLDYANTVLFGSPAKYITRLQRVQNAAARIVAQKPSYLSSVDTLQELHWLPIQWHIKFKLASLIFKATHYEVPPYLSHLLIPYRPSRVLRSSFSSNLLLTYCVSVSLQAYLWNLCTNRHEILCPDPLWLWLVLLWWHCDTLCTSSFMDEDTFGRSGPYGDVCKLNLEPTTTSSVVISGRNLMSMNALFIVLFYYTPMWNAVL